MPLHRHRCQACGCYRPVRASDEANVWCASCQLPGSITTGLVHGLSDPVHESQRALCQGDHRGVDFSWPAGRGIHRLGKSSSPGLFVGNAHQFAGFWQPTRKPGGNSREMKLWSFSWYGTRWSLAQQARDLFLEPVAVG